MQLKANRHPIDQLADIRAEIKNLQVREAELRDQLLEPGADLAGGEFYGRITDTVSNRLDREMLERVLGKEAVAACCKSVPSRTLRLIRREEDAA